MSAKTVLAEAVARGLTLTASGEKIIYTGPREAVTDDLLDRLRQHKAELLRLLPAETEKAGQVFTNYGTGYRHPDGRVDDGTPEPMPPPAEPWPADLTQLLRRVATAFEWSQQDVADFRRWARRSPAGVADARAFLEAEAARLPKPGLSDRRRVVLDMLAADPALRVAWTCADDGADPVRLVIAIRGTGAWEMAIPRAKFDALALPQLIDRLAQAQEAAP